jgi:hypothetical protein
MRGRRFDLARTIVTLELARGSALRITPLIQNPSPPDCAILDGRHIHTTLARRVA